MPELSALLTLRTIFERVECPYFYDHQKKKTDMSPNFDARCCFLQGLVQKTGGDGKTWETNGEVWIQLEKNADT